MFEDLFKLEKQRTAKEALGFYIACLLLIMIVGVVISLVFGTVLGASADFVYQLSWLAAVIICPLLSYKILSKKNLKMNTLYIVICISSGLGALWLGGFLGFIPVAYLTTVPKISLLDQ
tara:strand:- start:92 stop:448 length:357 start_codon:yes stop_codon:yes gene_type:complete